MDAKNSKYLLPNLRTVFRAAAIFITTSAALANPLIQKQTFSNPAGFSVPLTFDKFNAGGTLSSVRITLQLQISGGLLNIDNDGDSSVSGTLKFGVFGNADSTEVNLPLISSEVCYSQPFNLNGNINDGIGDYDHLPPDGMQFIGSSNSGTISAYVEDVFLNNYTGTGTFDIIVSIAQLVDYDDVNGDISRIEYSIVPPIETSGFIEVAYNIPEPASAAILALGMFLAARIKKRS